MAELRPDLATLCEWIQPGARVLDLGCGDGTLLKHLADTRNVSGYGIEIDPDNLATCVASGVNVIQTDLDKGLADYESDSFDFVVMTQALQEVQHPDRMLDEILRVGRRGIVTFPNFGHWRARLELALRGRMPVSANLPEQWYETRNIHLCTVDDFEALCAERNIRVDRRMMVNRNHRETTGMRALPNLLGETAIYQLSRKT